MSTPRPRINPNTLLTLQALREDPGFASFLTNHRMGNAFETFVRTLGADHMQNLSMFNDFMARQDPRFSAMMHTSGLYEQHIQSQISTASTDNGGLDRGPSWAPWNQPNFGS